MIPFIIGAGAVIVGLAGIGLALDGELGLTGPFRPVPMPRPSPTVPAKPATPVQKPVVTPKPQSKTTLEPSGYLVRCKSRDKVNIQTDANKSAKPEYTLYTAPAIKKKKNIRTRGAVAFINYKRGHATVLSSARKEFRLYAADVGHKEFNKLQLRQQIRFFPEYLAGKPSKAAHVILH